MSKIQRTPPQIPLFRLADNKCQSTVYGSDSALNISCTSVDEQDNLINITKRTKRRLIDTPVTSNLSIEKMFNELRLYQDNKFDVINSSISTLIEQNKEIQKSVDFMSEQYDTLVHKLNSIEKENQQYKSQIKSLESKVDVLEKGLRSTTVEIRNIPILEQENKQRLTTTIKNICSAVDSNPLLQDLEVRDVFRTKTNAIMVDFTTTTRKENFISKYREFNKLKRTKKEPQLNTQIINIPGPPKTIFISESLRTKSIIWQDSLLKIANLLPLGRPSESNISGVSIIFLFYNGPSRRGTAEDQRCIIGLQDLKISNKNESDTEQAHNAVTSNSAVGKARPVGAIESFTLESTPSRQDYSFYVRSNVIAASKFATPKRVETIASINKCDINTAALPKSPTRTVDSVSQGSLSYQTEDLYEIPGNTNTQYPPPVYENIDYYGEQCSPQPPYYHQIYQHGPPLPVSDGYYDTRYSKAQPQVPVNSKTKIIPSVYENMLCPDSDKKSEYKAQLGQEQQFVQQGSIPGPQVANSTLNRNMSHMTNDNKAKTDKAPPSPLYNKTQNSHSGDYPT
ncbi:unnamed protein product [Parnassius apollo]|uniref:(apollo) hypothetical protein n=1 Tax=Parnassius apollo TaxID=110799 RepID=A0A8S3XHP9_PARAO|nr:unnamed protein product [Parnassius apollo]